MRVKHNNATIYIYGEVNREKIEEATKTFMSYIQRSKKNGNNNTTRSIKEKSLLDK